MPSTTAVPAWGKLPPRTRISALRPADKWIGAEAARDVDRPMVEARLLGTRNFAPSDIRQRSRSAKRPRLAEKTCPRNRGRRERRVPNAPAASRARFWKHTSIVTTGTWKIRHSLRNGFNGLFRDLLGDRAFLPPSLSGELHQTWRQRRGVRTTQLCRPHQVLFVDALFARPTLLRPPHPIPRS